MLTSCTL